MPLILVSRTYIISGARKPQLPENSLPSLYHALASDGVDGVEIDIHFSQDNVPIVHHDFTLQRMCGMPRALRALTAAEITCLPFSDMTKTSICAAYPNVMLRPPFDSFCVPTLYQAMSLVKSFPGKQFFIEVKEFRNSYEQACFLAGFPLYVGEAWCLKCLAVLSCVIFVVTDMFASDPSMYHFCHIISFNPLVLYYLRRLDPRVYTSLLARRGFVSGHLKGLRLSTISALRPIMLL